ncbi:MAG: OmpA family protein [Pseudomonadota bacterium]
MTQRQPRPGGIARPLSRFLTRLVTAACLLLPLTGHTEEALRATLFAEASAALKSANEARASLLAPKIYADAGEDYSRAEELLAEGGNLDAIRRSLGKASEKFSAAATAARRANTAFAATLAAREAADQAGAREYARETWVRGEESLSEAARRLEADREKSALENAAQAEEAFRAAELTAIKASFLDDTRGLLKQAKEERAERYAPATYSQAAALLAEAETQLEADRYDTDRPRNIARQAKHEAYHAIYLARVGDEVRRDRSGAEKVLLGWEDSLRRLANVLDVPIYFDNGEAAAINAMISKVNDLNALIDRLAQDVGDREAQVIALQTEVGELTTRLGGEAAAVQSLNALLERQEEHRRRFAQVENSYLLSEATVLRQGNDVIIRMVGLNFDSGKAEIKPEHEELLTKLAGSVGIFPRSTLSIEGHTDAYGSDATNLALSEKRAQAVREHLIGAGIDGLRMNAVGYGESRPVANNETATGRARNRRIDVIITPFEES